MSVKYECDNCGALLDAEPVPYHIIGSVLTQKWNATVTVRFSEPPAGCRDYRPVLCCECRILVAHDTLRKLGYGG